MINEYQLNEVVIEVFKKKWNESARVFTRIRIKLFKFESYFNQRKRL